MSGRERGIHVNTAECTLPSAHSTNVLDGGAALHLQNNSSNKARGQMLTSRPVCTAAASMRSAGCILQSLQKLRTYAGDYLLCDCIHMIAKRLVCNLGPFQLPSA